MGSEHARNILANENLEIYLEYGLVSGEYNFQTVQQQTGTDVPIEVGLDDLEGDTQYYFRLRFKNTTGQTYNESVEYSFHTQRAAGSSFTFTVTSDSHIRWDYSGKSPSIKVDLYERTLTNVAEDHPDFHIDLGDTFFGAESSDPETTKGYYLEQRPFLGLITHSAPLFLVLGNLDGTPDNISIWATNARKLYYPNPVPGGFYTGNSNTEPFIEGDGLRENYYAWEWGDALFIVLDPYAYTLNCPHCRRHRGGPASNSGWDWTIGDEQYEWLKQTLDESDATFKFVFAHQTTAGVNLYGRGGIEGAKYYEWGGYEKDGKTWGFTQNRPNWEMPIHDLIGRCESLSNIG